jgi:hypothetical protein
MKGMCYDKLSEIPGIAQNRINEFCTSCANKKIILVWLKVSSAHFTYVK